MSALIDVTIAFISHPQCREHHTVPGHPESSARLAAVEDQLLASGLELALRRHEAPEATREQLCRVHTPAYVDAVLAVDPEPGQVVWMDADTSMSAGSLGAALRAAGAAVRGVDLVMAGAETAAFCNVRPPGHHAGRGRPMGFCIFNNVAVGAAHALAAHGLERVAIADFDVHHGNGTEEIFAGDERVLFCSTFQHPFYPHSGAGDTAANVINAPLAAGSNGAAFRAAVESRWLPALARFRPQLLLISAGFDGHVADELAGLALVEADYAWVTRALKSVADAHAGGRIVSSLEGGYELNALGRSAVAHLNALLGTDLPA